MDATTKRISHWLIGFIHGPIYDRLIYFDSAIFYSRFFAFLVGLYIPIRLLAGSRQEKAAARSIGFVALFLFLLSYGKFSTSNLRRKLDEALPLVRNYKQLTLHYSNGDKNIDQLYKEAKFHYDELERSLGVPEKVIHAYIYPNQKSKKLWFGGGNTDVADVYTPSIHISSRTNISHPTLRHELVHAFSSFYAYHGLGFHPNMALTEGLAEALAPIRRSLDLDTASGYLIENKKVGRVSDLLALILERIKLKSIHHSWIFDAFLIDNYDLSRVKRLYMGESLESVFPNEHEAVITSWKSMVIEKYQKSKSDIEAESLYRSPGILRDVCPHAKTLLYSKHESPWQTLRQPYNWNYKNYWSWRTMINPNDRYATYKVKRAEVISRLKKKKSVDLKELAASYELPPKNTEDIELALLHHDALVASEQELRSDSLIDELKELSLNLDLSQSLTRSIWARYMLRGKNYG